LRAKADAHAQDRWRQAREKSVVVAASASEPFSFRREGQPRDEYDARLARVDGGTFLRIRFHHAEGAGQEFIAVMDLMKNEQIALHAREQNRLFCSPVART